MSTIFTREYTEQGSDCASGTYMPGTETRCVHGIYTAKLSKTISKEAETFGSWGGSGKLFKKLNHSIL